MNDFKYRVLNQNDGTILWAGSGKREASRNYQNALDSLQAAGIHTYITLQELKGERYQSVKGRIV